MGTKARLFTPIAVVSLEDLVPSNHFYRHLDRVLDLSFVRDLVKETYACGGRPSIDPVVFFKLQLVLFFEDIRSERLLMQLVADKLSVRWYVGYNLDEPSLMFLVNERERFTEIVKQAEETNGEDTIKYLPSQDIDDKYFEGLRAEVYFIEMHQFESFFALLLAYFHKLPDWLYLTTYGTAEIKTAIQNYVDGNILAATNGAVSTREHFIISAVYSEHYSDVLRENSQWNESIDGIDWFIKRAGKRYLEASSEYNGYKHGLRVLTGHSRLAMWPNDAAGNPLGQGFIIGDSEDSISFLALEDKGEGGETVVEVTKHFNPKESFAYIQIMQFILDEVMRTRRARINREALEHLQTIFIDREKLQH